MLSQQLKSPRQEVKGGDTQPTGISVSIVP